MTVIVLTLYNLNQSNEINYWQSNISWIVLIFRLSLFYLVIINNPPMQRYYDFPTIIISFFFQSSKKPISFHWWITFFSHTKMKKKDATTLSIFTPQTCRDWECNNIFTRNRSGVGRGGYRTVRYTKSIYLYLPLIFLKKYCLISCIYVRKVYQWWAKLEKWWSVDIPIP